jgi:GT2 family glycosyltransferase
MPPDAAIVVVNFNSGDYLRGCVASLDPALQGGMSLEIVVVDCASTVDQSAHLAAVADGGAGVCRLDRNGGYAAGCNHGLRLTTAGVVCFLNADVVARPMAVPELVRRLRQAPAVGMVEPRCSVDDARHWLQPSFRLLRPRDLAASALGRLVPACERRRQLRELRGQIEWWTATSPFPAAALSGAFVATRREVLDRVGAFDEGYPLAYEDTDLFARMRAAGYALELVPAAEAIHYGHRSRITVLAESVAKDRAGRRRYLQRHGRAALWLDRVSEFVQCRFAARPLWPSQAIAPSAGGSPPTLALLGQPGPFVLQLSYDPSFQVAAGHFGDSSSYTFPATTWASLLPTAIFVRAFARETFEPRGAWTLQRVL